MNAALFGGTGFVGSYLVDALLARDIHPVVLVREGSEHRLNQADKCTLVHGDIQNQDAIRSTLANADAAIYNIGILREFPSRGITFQTLQSDGARSVIDMAGEAGVKRFLLMSANGVGPDGTPYQQTKYEAEQYLMASKLQWTIFQPSVIFGDPRGRMEFATQLADDIIRPPLPAPLFHDGLLPFGAGRFALSPVHVENVAEAFVRSLENEHTIGRTLRLGGDQALTWRQILETIANTVGKRKIMLPVPACGVAMAASLLQRFEAFPITRDQIRMLMQGNTCPADVLVELGIRPIAFDAENLAYLAA